MKHAGGVNEHSLPNFRSLPGANVHNGHDFGSPPPPRANERKELFPILRRFVAAAIEIA